MGPSIDGRIAGVGYVAKLGEEYERTAGTFRADGWIIGRVSMEPYAGKTRIPRRNGRGRISRRDFIADADAKSYAIAIDPSGKLTWRSNAIGEDRVITILTERVPDDYLAFLQSKRVSYVFAGKTDIDLRTALSKLRRKFGIRKLLLEGGGKINGSFLAEDLIDELSILIAPVADGSNGTPTLFDTETSKSYRRKLRLISVKKIEGDMVWLRYRM